MGNTRWEHQGTTPEGTELYCLNMGPQHPSTHGVLKVILELEGDGLLAMDILQLESDGLLVFRRMSIDHVIPCWRGIPGLVRERSSRTRMRRGNRNTRFRRRRGFFGHQR